MPIKRQSWMMKHFFWNIFTAYSYHFCFWEVFFNPDILAKKSNSWRIPPIVAGEPSKKREISSAYCRILYFTPLIFMPLIFLFFLIKFSNISAQIKNRAGDIGLPCLHPLCGQFTTFLYVFSFSANKDLYLVASPINLYHNFVVISF